MRKINYILYIVIIGFSCKESKEHDSKHSEIVKYIIKDKLEENKNLFEYIRYHYETGSRELPITKLMTLNNLVTKEVDRLINENPAEINPDFENTYQRRWDSLIMSDKRIKQSVEKNPLPIAPDAGDQAGPEYAFWKAQILLIKQNFLLKNVLAGYSYGAEGIDTIDDIGYQIFIKEYDTLEVLDISFKLNSRMKCIPQKPITLISSKGDTILPKKIDLKGDHIYITTGKLQQGSYQAEIRYKMIREAGFETESTLYFPFSL